MPSTMPLHEVRDFLRAARSALTGERDRYGDRRSGALYNHASGPMAVLLSREEDRDKDAFGAIYFDDATSDDLTDLVQERFLDASGNPLVPRILDTYGVGATTFRRSSAAAGAGTIWAGTRIEVQGTLPRIFVVTADTPVTASALTAENVPIRPDERGSGQGQALTFDGLSLIDALFDPLLQPTSLQCGDGTDFEPAEDYRARTRSTLIDRRNGYAKRITDVCQAAGAVYVMPFASRYGLAASDFLDDHGCNAVYVADANFSSTAALVNACDVALEACRVLGADLWVGGITQTQLQIGMLLNLIDDPGRLDVVPIRRAASAALLQQFGPSDAGFIFKASALSGAVVRSSPSISHASVPYPWTASTLYGVGDLVVASPDNGLVYQAAVAGQSGLSQPSWSTVVGAGFLDHPGSPLTWQVTSYASASLGLFAAGVRINADVSLTPSAWPATLTRYTLPPRLINFILASPL